MLSHTPFRGAPFWGIRRGDHYIGEPPVDVDLRPGDELIVHGRRARIAHLREGVD